MKPQCPSAANATFLKVNCQWSIGPSEWTFTPEFGIIRMISTSRPQEDPYHSRVDPC